MEYKVPGIYRDGIVRLAEEVPFDDEQNVVVLFTKPDRESGPVREAVDPGGEKEWTFEELKSLFNCVRLDTRGWKFNREEANER